MVANNIFSRSIFSLLFTLLPSLVFSTQLMLTPNNLPEIMNELSIRYEEDISISMNELQQFLAQNIAGTFDANLSAPAPEISEMDDEQIAFVWPSVVNANNYVSRYLNLENGDFNDLTTENPSASFILDNHFFMYTFQAISTRGQGRIWIIIHDKPLAIGTTFIERDCFCKNPQYSNSYYLSTSDQTMVQATALSSWEEDYSISLSILEQNSSTSIDAGLFLKLKGGNLSINEAFFDGFGECTLNINHDQFNIYITDPNNNNSNAVVFSFIGGQMRFRSLSQDYTGTLSISKCILADSPSDKRTQDYAALGSGHVFPNPTTGLVSLNLPNSTQDLPSRIILKNTTGQTLEDFQSLNGPRQEINLSSYPSGTYYLQVITGEQSEVFPIIKIE